MTFRRTAKETGRSSQTSASRCTLREFDDDHDMMQIKQADIYHSETQSDFERWQQCGTSVHPMPQDKQDQQTQGQQGQQDGQDGGFGSYSGDGAGEKNPWSSKQPKGPSSEGLMLYLNGSRSHPICAAIDDRRVRPYQTKPGECLYYAADGSGQTMYHRVRGDDKDGLYILTLDDQQQNGVYIAGYGVGQQKQQKRFVSIRHANKQKQKRKSKSLQAGQQGGQGGQGSQLAADGGGQGGQQQQDYKHEGDSINTEVQLTSGKINFNDGGGNVGFYDNQKKDWLHHDGKGATHSMRADKGHSHIKHEGAHIWVDGACWSSMPIQIKDDPCT